MKNFTLPSFVLFFLFAGTANAQLKRCITNEKMQEVFRNDPTAKQRFENLQRTMDEKVAEYLKNPAARLLRTNATYFIPVVVHIATANPAQITNATVQAQLDTLNWYYGSQSTTDSLRVYTPFRTAYGRSSIRFCLAQRDPAGQATSGIERVTTSVVFSGSSAHPSTVVSAWNTQLYLNMWVVNFGSSGILGYSYLPGTFPIGDQRIGFVADYRAFGSGASYLFSTYNGGKTCVHEIGHFFNLNHPWGPVNDPPGNPNCTLSDGCSDTPPTNGATYGCPTAVPILNACSPAAPGIMWQNHMDYADDACMVLFTKEQCARMDLALTTAPDRSTLINSNGCQAVPAVPNDAGISTIVSPSSSTVNCSSSVAPQVTLQNYGNNNLTSVTISVTVNGVAQTGYPYAWTGNLAPNGTANLTLPPINLNVNGNNTIVISTSLPNGVADGNPLNDSKTVTVPPGGNFRSFIQEGFETTPTGWTVSNPDNDNTWVIASVGSNSSRSAFIDNFDYNVVGHLDELRSPVVNIGSYDSLFVSFDLAHRNYPGANDRLQVIAVTGCGSTSVPTPYSKAGVTLATGAPQTTSFLNPTPPEWRRETIAIGRSILGTGNNVLIAFRNTNNYGNNIFIDNVNIVPLFRRDLKVASINQPNTLTCSTSVTPSVTVQNNGTEIITGYKLQYSIDNGAPQTARVISGVSIPRFATATVNLAAITASAGPHTIKIYSFEPVTASGSGDEYTPNDTLTRSFNILNTVSAPLVENFTGAAFPPANWVVLNPDGNVTWRRNAVGNGNLGSAFVNTYNYPSNGQIDDLVTPFVRYGGVDSVKLSFDLAAATYSYPGSTAIPLDTLEILASNDCGNSFTSVYKKFGIELQTLNAPNDPQIGEFVPSGANQWRTENIDLSQFAGDNQLALIFRVVNNYENNIFVDNVNLRTQTLPSNLKQQGYVVYPATFQNSFNVWHYQTPTNLKFVNVYNSAGQLVWSKQFSGNADRQMTVDLTGKAAGIYMVELGYTDSARNVTQKVVKY